MKKLSKIMAGALVMCSFAAGESAAGNIKFEPQKTLVVYFSAGGNTARAANLIAQNLGAKIVELKPVQPYTNADLNYTIQKVALAESMMIRRIGKCLWLTLKSKAGRAMMSFS